MRAGSALFLYERYPRSCFKILKTDPFEISSSLASFLIDTCFLRFIWFFTFWIIPLVLIMRGRPVEYDKLIEPVSFIILHHRRTVQTLTKPFKSSKIFVRDSPFWYLESTSFWISSLFILENFIFRFHSTNQTHRFVDKRKTNKTSKKKRSLEITIGPKIATQKKEHSL
mgnify:CR=1 FL=1